MCLPMPILYLYKLYIDRCCADLRDSEKVDVSVEEEALISGGALVVAVN